MEDKKQTLTERITQLPFIKNILDWSKRTPLPGFEGISIYTITAFIILEAEKDNLTTRANSVSFSFMLAIFPSIIFIFTLLPHLPISTDYVSMLNNSFLKLLPNNAHEYLYNIILDITSIKRQGLLSFGFVLAVYFSSSGMMTLMSGFDKSYNLSFKQRNYWQKSGIAIGLTMILTILFVVSIIFIVMGNKIFNFIDASNSLPSYIKLLFTAARWLIPLILVYTGISIIYRFGPSLRKRLHMINPGSILATISSMISSIAFSYFVNNFGKYNELYGSIGALLVIMVWIQINAFILLVGFELNAAIAVNRDLLAAETSASEV